MKKVMTSKEIGVRVHKENIMSNWWAFNRNIQEKYTKENLKIQI